GLASAAGPQAGQPEIAPGVVIPAVQLGGTREQLEGLLFSPLVKQYMAELRQDFGGALLLQYAAQFVFGFGEPSGILVAGGKQFAKPRSIGSQRHGFFQSLGSLRNIGLRAAE